MVEKDRAVSMLDLDGRSVAVMTLANEARQPIVSRGGRLAWVSNGSLVTTTVENPDERTVIEIGEASTPTCLFAGERVIVCVHGDVLVAATIQTRTVLPLDTEVSPELAISPDGGWVAYLRGDAAHRRLRVSPVDRAAPVPALEGDPPVTAHVVIAWLRAP